MVQGEMTRRRIVLAVTIDDSLQFLTGYPEYLTQRGWEVHVVSGAGPRLRALEELPHVFTHQVEMQRNPSALQDFKSLRIWLRLLRRIRPSAISVGTPKASLLGTIAALLLRVPVRVYLLRGLRLETSTGLSRQILIAAERITMLCATNVIAVSRSLMARSIELKLAPQRKMRVLGGGSSNGTDIVEFDSSRFSATEIARVRQEIGLRPELPVVGFVGRLTRDKGLFVLADALEILVQRGVHCQVLIVGGVDDPTGDAALERLRGVQIPVVVTGYVARPASHYAVMDVFCLPSFREGFVNVVIEASSSGIPVVASDATGVIDAVRDGETGLVSPVGDAMRLAQNLETILADPTLAARLGARGRQWVSANFSRHEVQQRYADDLESLVEAVSIPRRKVNRVMNAQRGLSGSE
jgi:glycosyltransferase involved in cell wall biosynthesis